MKKVYFLISIFVLSQLAALAQDPDLFFNLNNSESGNRHYRANQYINCLPEDDNDPDIDGFSYTAITGEAFVAEIDPLQVIIPDEGSSTTYDYYVGTTNETVDVDQFGNISVNIPIEIPSTTTGLAPQLNLNYNSSNGSGYLGQGWKLSGLSTISRIGNDIYHDGTRKPLNIDEDDKFVLDGNRLILGSGIYGEDQSAYTTEVFTGFRITSLGQKGKGPLSFKIETGDGKTIWYGENEDSRVLINRNGVESVLKWFISRVEDNFGNQIKYIYKSNTDSQQNEINSYEVYIDEILYGGIEKSSDFSYKYKVKFNYNERDNSINQRIQYILGNKYENSQILSSIDIKSSDDVKYKTYELLYTNKDNIYCLQDLLVRNGENSVCNQKYYFVNRKGYETNFSLEPGTFDQTNLSLYDHQFGDFNGDGRDDLLICMYSGTENDKVYTSYKIMTGSGSEGNFAEWVSGDLDDDFEKFVIGDYNGDGRDDLVRIRKQLTNLIEGDYYLYYAQFLINNGQSLIETNDEHLIDADAEFNPEWEIFSSIDITGDGVDDLFTLDYFDTPNDNNAKICLSCYDFINDNWICYEYEFDDDSDVAKNKPVFGHFNNDGLIDVLVTTSENSAKILSYNRSDGYDIIAELNDPKQNMRRFSGDFNGDNLTDLIVFNTYEDEWELLFNSGDIENLWIIGEEPGLQAYDPHLVTYEVAVADFNGDGLDDIMEYYYNSGGSHINLFQSIGEKFLKHEKDYVNVVPIDNSFTYSDVNGDNQTEVSFRYGWDVEFNYFNKNQTTKLLATVFPITGTIFEFKYATAANTVYTPNFNSFSNSNGKLVDFLPGNYMCKSIERYFYFGSNENNKRAHSTFFKYEGMKVNVNARKNMGFTQISKNDYSKRKTVTDKYGHNDDYYFVEKDYSETTYEDETYYETFTLKYSEFNYSYKNVSLIGQEQSIIQYPEVINIKTYDYEDIFLNTSRKTLALNDQGNIDVSTSFLSSSELDIEEPNTSFEYSTISNFEYTSSDVVNWISPRLLKETRTSVSPNMPDDVSITEYDYYSYGEDDWPNLKNITKNGNAHSLALQIEYDYDDFGRTIKETQSTPNYLFNSQGLQDRITEYKYGENNDQQYLSHIINPEGHIIEYLEYDDRFGLPIKIKDVSNSNADIEYITEYEYDNFGRQKKIINPDGTMKEQGYKWVIESNTDFPNASFFSWVSASGASPVLTYFDKNGREIGTKSYGINGETILTRKKYDNKERLEYVYNYQIDDEVNITRYQYDENNRISRIDNNLNAENIQGDEYLRYVYDGHTTFEYYKTEDGEESTKIIKDARGLNKYVYDELDNSIENIYRPNGLLKETKVHNNSTKFEYDINGNRTKIDDPSSGIINSKYNPYGELMEISDEEGNITSYSYDKLGRELHMNDSDGNIITSVYDTKKAGLLSSIELVKAEDSEDYINQKFEFDYDNYLRQISKTETIEGEEFLFKYKYDELGRLNKLTYPTELEIKYIYGNQGAVEKIKNLGNNNTIWEINADGYDYLGRPVNYTMNDTKVNVLKSYYDNGMLSDIKVSSNEYSNIKDWHYTYDVSGNMKTRDLRINNDVFLLEEFNYNELNMLEDATATSFAVGSPDPYTIDYNYDPNGTGNITNINTIGSFEYGQSTNAGPYAISGIDFSVDNIDMPKQVVNYTSFNKIRYLSHLDENENIIDEIELLYGLDHQRSYQKLTLLDGTIKEKYFIGGLYEKEIENGITKEICYINTPVGTAAICEKKTNKDNWYFLTHDHIGSIHYIFNEDGIIEQELSFDPFGNRRDPFTWQPFENESEPEYVLDRGYTMHEHWDDFSLINMNGRVYDPVISRFLSPDPNITYPGVPQNYNRYSYAMNNPLIFIDPSGEDPFTFVAIGLYLGFVYLNTAHANQDENGNWAWNPADWFADNNGDGMPDGTFEFGIYMNSDYDLGGYGGYRTPGGAGFYGGYNQNNGFGIGASDGYGSPAFYYPGQEDRALERNGYEATEDARLEYMDEWHSSSSGGYSDIWGAALVTTGVLLADDATGIGVADDVAIPFVWAGAASVAAYRYMNKTTAQYALVARTDGDYPVYVWGSREPVSNVRLYAGDVWKYGITSQYVPGTNNQWRYSQAQLNRWNVEFIRQVEGSRIEALYYENLRLVNYYNLYGTLPPGNKIFR